MLSLANENRGRDHCRMIDAMKRFVCAHPPLVIGIIGLCVLLSAIPVAINAHFLLAHCGYNHSLPQYAEVFEQLAPGCGLYLISFAIMIAWHRRQRRPFG